MKTSQAKQKINEVREKAWNDFKLRYPDADMKQFQVKIEINGMNDVTGTVQFHEGPGYWSDVHGSDPKYWSDAKRKALGIGGFPTELTLNLIKKIPIFSETAEPFGHYFNEGIRIHVTPDNYFMTTFREIFQGTVISHASGRESKKWLSGPDMKYWPQQLNFAF